MTMREILYYTLNVVSIAFVVYGIYVFWIGHKIVKKTDAMLDELYEDDEQ